MAYDFDHAKFKFNLGKNIARIRKSKGYSQDRLCLEAGFARGTMSKIEAGHTEPKASTLFLISDTLGVPVSKLFDFKPK